MNFLLKDDTIIVIEKKLNLFNDMIQTTILNAQNNKSIGILEINDINKCVSSLNSTRDKIQDLYVNNEYNTIEKIINYIQTINNDLSGVFKMYGTRRLEDLICVCFGTIKFNKNEDEMNKYELLNQLTKINLIIIY